MPQLDLEMDGWAEVLDAVRDQKQRVAGVLGQTSSNKEMEKKYISMCRVEDAIINMVFDYAKKGEASEKVCRD